MESLSSKTQQSNTPFPILAKLEISIPKDLLHLKKRCIDQKDLTKSDIKILEQSLDCTFGTINQDNAAYKEGRIAFKKLS